MSSASDIAAIVALLNRAAEILDLREWNRLGTVYIPDADAYGSQGLPAIETLLRSTLGGCGPSHHMLGNYQVQVEGDRATSRTKYRAMHQGVGQRSNLTYESVGEYYDEHVRTTGGWRVASRRVDVRMRFGDRSVLQPG